MDNVLEIRNVSRDLKSFRLDNINLTLERGYVMGLIGPNGAGKTSLIRLVLNLLRKDSGSVRIFGMDHIENEKEVKERIGFVYDENIYPESLRLGQLGKLLAGFYRRWDHQMFMDYLKMFDLDPEKKLAKLSKGMKMKFSIAAALSHHAELIIMDEPTSGLDPVFRRELLDILHGLMEDGERSIIFSTHITSDLDRIADVITLMDNGRIALSVPFDEIIENYRVIKGPKALAEKIDQSWLCGIRINKFGFEALCTDGAKAAREYGNAVVLEKPSIEDIMFYYSGKVGVGA